MKKDTVHWADVIAEEILKRGEKHIIATGITPSGPIHIGNLREIITADAISRALLEKGADARLIYIADTYDPLRTLYPFLPEKFKEHVGKPLSEIPDPEGCCENYAEHFLTPFLDALDELGIEIEVIRADEVYKRGDYVDAIKTALSHRDDIAKIIDDVSGKRTSKNWSPFNPICKKCGRMNSTVVREYKGDSVYYSCECGEEGEVKMAGGGKLTWRVDWPARWKIFNVTIEPFGKDHAVSGSSYDSGKRIAREIYSYEPPYPVPFEHIIFKGRGKMSSSKGVVVSIGDILEVLPPEVVRYLIIKTKPEKHIEFDPGLPLLNLLDEYDGMEENDRIFELSSIKEGKRLKIPFRHLVNAVQIARGDFHQLLEVLRRSGYDTSDEEGIKIRAKKAEKWIEKFAPSFVKFEVKEELPDVELSPSQKEGLKILSDRLGREWKAEELHNEIYKIAEEIEMDPKDLFRAIYLSLLGSESGPRAGWFLLSLDREFLKKRFREVEKR
ncbi:MAG: lysine--tRNA ligase [Candidatus Syntropharchaeia archaeon]